MSTTFAELAAMTDPQQRGYAFEHYIADLLRREQFEVIHNPGAANGRQVDLFANRGDRHYLVEAKWRKAKLGVREVDELLRRLERGAPNIVGVLISGSGFARTAAARVERDSAHPVLLVTGAELGHLEANPTLHRLLVDKHQRLITHRRATVAEAPDHVSPALSGSVYPDQGGHRFVEADGHRTPVVEFAGDFGPVAYCLKLPDLDWGDGYGVGIEIALTESDSAGLRRVFTALGERGWITAAGTWRIHQQGATWNGFGLGALVAALDDPESRYANRTMHHSETITYVDAAGGGLYTLTAQVGRTRYDQVSMVTLTFRLPGIPLDPGPLQTLARGLTVGGDLYFRPLNRPIATRMLVPAPIRTRRLRAEAFVVGDPPMLAAGDSRDNEEWVVGAIIANPFRGSRTRPWADHATHYGVDLDLAREDFLICTLGSWHFLSERRDYVIDFIEDVQLGDRRLIRVQLDWFDEHFADKVTRTPRGIERFSPALGSAIRSIAHGLDVRRGRGRQVSTTEDSVSAAAAAQLLQRGYSSTGALALGRHSWEGSGSQPFVA